MKKLAAGNENTNSQAVANSAPEKKVGEEVAQPFEDRRPQALAQRKLQAMMDGSAQVQQIRAVQKKADSRSGGSVEAVQAKAAGAKTVQAKYGSAKTVQAKAAGAKTVQAKAGANSARTVQAKSSPSGNVVQRVEDEGLRVETDPEIDALKVRTVLILQQLQKKGGDWKTKWGDAAKKKVKEKAKDKLDGKKGDSVESMIAKKIWENLTLEEKLTVCGRVVTEGTRAIGIAIREAPEMSGSGKEKQKDEPKPKPKEKEEREDSRILGKVMDMMGELTAEDLKSMYDFMKGYGEFKDRVEEAKTEIVDELGKIGQGVGEFVGEMKDEHEFEKLIGEFKPEFLGALNKYHDLVRKIKANKDVDRYNDELYALQQALDFKPGIWAAMVNNGNMIPKYRIAFPELCTMNLEEIVSARRNLVDAHKQKGLRSLIMNIESPAVGDSRVPVALERASSALKRVVHQSWSKVTKWKSVPNGVGSLRELSRGLDAKPYLEAAKAINFGKAGSNRDPITGGLYAAITGLNLTSVESLDQATVAFNKTEADLGKKK